MDPLNLGKRFSIMRNEAHALMPFAVFDAEVQRAIALCEDKDDAVMFIREKVRQLYACKMDALMDEMMSGNTEYLACKALHDLMPGFTPDYYP